MYEETKSSIDWKGIFLKVIIAFLVILIAVKGYSILKGDNKDAKTSTTTNTIVDNNDSQTISQNLEKLSAAGKKYFNKNSDKVPTKEGNTSMVTLKELVDNGYLASLTYNDGKICDGESSYVSALYENGESKLKTNLVCGDTINSEKDSLTYMDVNDKETEEVKSNNNSSSKTNVSNTSNKTTSSNTQTSTNKSSNTCGTACNVPNVSANSNATANSNIIINEKENTKKDEVKKEEVKQEAINKETVKATKYFTVRFDSNGGNNEYSSQDVKENQTAKNPGNTYRTGYTFKGWYLNGTKYDFSTPVTKDIELIAKFTRNSYYDDEYYDDEYNYDYDYDDYYDNVLTSTTTSTVYSLMWDNDGTDDVYVSHTLRIPAKLENRNDIVKVRIKSVSINRTLGYTDLSSYRANHADTFIYSKNHWEATGLTKNNLAKINTSSSYTKVIPLTTRYKDIDTAIEEGFDVEWYTNRVTAQCKTPFSVTGPNNEIDYNNCAYGIVYKVTWEYQYYN